MLGFPGRSIPDLCHNLWKTTCLVGLVGLEPVASCRALRRPGLSARSLQMQEDLYDIVQEQFDILAAQIEPCMKGKRVFIVDHSSG